MLCFSGYTGQLTTRYLSTHPQRAEFTFAVGARSREKLEKLAKDLNLGDDVELVQVDVTNADDVERAVANAKVVVNTVGPYWRWGTNVVKACAKLGKGYLDLSGEGHWVARMIWHYDYLATKTGAVIVPACGLDSVPSDIAAFLANKTLKALAGLESTIERTDTAVEVKGTVSGGTLNTIMTVLEEVPKHELAHGTRAYALSPGLTGRPNPPLRLLYTLPASSPRVYGSFFVMAPTNRQIVQRTWGLHQLAALRGGPKEKALAYGPDFTYDEFLATPSALGAVLMSAAFAVFGLALLLPPVRWILKKIRPPGTGGSYESLENGHMTYTSITTSSPDSAGKQTYVRTSQRGRGDPGYLLTSMMIAEGALALVLDKKDLPALAQQGGILTPMSALGDVLIRRLEGTGRFEFESEVVLAPNEESRKTR
ncbi:hypothetical protein GLOTRDRAFT_116281 [Gloeophyllum trabeum ATCC 11539]|uniref:Saccharopine dehydrogenase NADP binding domain-containing protein n=1 Tax=Gloeophyllum trabeum (strain ATCC 11539 / FP-39264 / Madison 617) TaxID=670483 RepID=S7Q7E5_GLOTA|nr:uncharacterized protein GLOTRDRAFT_116281 [Gloeophyllum trabeum ATCC 11539]EPQ55373.1 hypothetical protein GLOTRDRAFT_116281 [Gloeophyllum trabeum ATCC 11539]